MKNLRLFVFIGLLVSLLSACTYNPFSQSEPFTKSTALHSFKPSIQVAQAWSVNAGVGSNDTGLALRPAIVGSEIIAANADGVVNAYNLKTGKQLWSKNIGTSITSSPAAKDGIVVVGAGNSTMYVMNQKSGKVLWHLSIPNTMIAAPAINQDLIVGKALGGTVFSVNRKTKKLLWGYKHPAPMLTLRLSSSPVIVGNHVLVGFADGTLALLNNNNGTRVWNQRIAMPQGSYSVQRLVDIDATPVVRNNMIYVVTYQGQLAALKLMSGKIVWHHKLSSYSGMALNNNNLFVTSANGVIWAFNRYTGSISWKMNQLKYRHVTGPVLMHGALVVADREGYMHWLSPDDGRFLARVNIGSTIVDRPLVAGKLDYIATQNGYLNAYRVHG